MITKYSKDTSTHFDFQPGHTFSFVECAEPAKPVVSVKQVSIVALVAILSDCFSLRHKDFDHQLQQPYSDLVDRA